MDPKVKEIVADMKENFLSDITNLASYASAKAGEALKLDWVNDWYIQECRDLPNSVMAKYLLPSFIPVSIMNPSCQATREVVSQRSK